MQVMNILSHMREGYTRPEMNTAQAPVRSLGRWALTCTDQAVPALPGWLGREYCSAVAYCLGAAYCSGAGYCLGAVYRSGALYRWDAAYRMDPLGRLTPGSYSRMGS